ncbi:hypothetical protein [Ottowia sp. SB7-C50]|uniref:hypothetical protein n=1 Tax=Ottowia sp. SB7-C50 TaxID=3081231 RepID=UPI002953FF65|nr:hypothetical protein [Ottowia sp. SB7-C50]WOP16988.1 hypothetical protein R0D99_08450 [Ottowia sp. SB7-C50]
MRLQALFLTFAMLLAALLAGCATTRTEYRPPADPQGRMCITNCSGIKQSCEMSQQMIRQQCEHDFQRREAAFRRCEAEYRSTPTSVCTQWTSRTVTVNGRTETRQECMVTSYKSNPCQRPNTTCNSGSSCDRNYDQCFVGCGGQIVEVPLD